MFGIALCVHTWCCRHADCRVEQAHTTTWRILQSAPIFWDQGFLILNAQELGRGTWRPPVRMQAHLHATFGPAHSCLQLDVRCVPMPLPDYHAFQITMRCGYVIEGMVHTPSKSASPTFCRQATGAAAAFELHARGSKTLPEVLSCVGPSVPGCDSQHGARLSGSRRHCKRGQQAALVRATQRRVHKHLAFLAPQGWNTSTLHSRHPGSTCTT